MRGKLNHILFFTIISWCFFSCKREQRSAVLSERVDKVYDSISNSQPPFKKSIDSLYLGYKNCDSDSCRIENIMVLWNYLSGEVKREMRGEVLKASNKIHFEKGIKKVQLYLLYFYGSKSDIDSVNHYYNLIKTWTEKTNNIAMFCENEIYYGNYYAYQREFRYSDSIIQCAIDKLKYNKVEDDYLFSTAYYILGKSKNVQFQNNVAINYLSLAADHAIRDELYEVAADIYFRIGECYLMETDFNRALEAYSNSLDIALKINDENSIASDYGAIGEIYSTKNDFVKAEEYLFKSYNLAKKINYHYQEAYTAASIAYMYFQQEKYTESLKYFDISNKTYQEFNKEAHWYEIERNNLSIAILYNAKKEYDKAKIILDKILDSEFIKEDPSFESEVYFNLAEIFNAKGDYTKAENYMQKALHIAKENQFLTIALDAYKKLFQLYESNKDFAKAFIYHKQYAELNDSLTNKPQIKKFAELENKIKEDRLNAEHQQKELTLLSEKTIKEEQLNRQRITSMVVTIGFVVIFIFAVIIYRNLQDNKRKTIIISEQKREAERQNLIIEEKKKEILDSIEYAKKIQEAILPPIESIKQCFPNSFILYKPKDIVAGDFYWLVNMKEHFMFAAADCTGHGVPGAMVSVVCSNALNRAVNEFNLVDPGKILDKVRELIIETFQKSGSEVKDGMDISLLVIPKMQNGDQRKVLWAGANNPLWYISNNLLSEVRPNKQPVGKFIKHDAFTTNELNLFKGDSLYLITDGFADQFGGPKGKKFKYRTLKEEIFKLKNCSMQEQGNSLSLMFENWKKDLEQIDDVTLIGIKL